MQGIFDIEEVYDLIEKEEINIYNAYVARFILERVIENSATDILDELTFDEVELFKYCLYEEQIHIMHYLIRERWNDEYISICGYDDDLLLDIVKIRPKEYHNVLKYLKCPVYRDMAGRSYHTHPMKLRS